MAKYIIIFQIYNPIGITFIHDVTFMYPAGLSDKVSKWSSALEADIPHSLWEFHNVIGSCHYINEIRAILSVSWENRGFFSTFFYYNSKIKVGKRL